MLYSPTIEDRFLNKEFKRTFTTEQVQDGIGEYEYWGATFYDSIKTYFVGNASLIFAGINDSLEDVEDFFEDCNDEIVDALLGDGELHDIDTYNFEMSYEYGVVIISIEFTAL